MKTNYLLIIVALLALLLSGCQSTSSFYRGKVVAPQDIIPLPGSTENDRWETFDLAIRYSYSESATIFNINGQLQMSQHFTMNYTHLRRLDVFLVFIDNESRVVETALLVNNPHHDIEKPIYFSRQLAIPSAAVAFSFAYDGTAWGSDGERKGSSHSFWHLPRNLPE